MKNKFIELTLRSNAKILVNLDNITSIDNKMDFTGIHFNDKTFSIVEESYDQVREMVLEEPIETNVLRILIEKNVDVRLLKESDDVYDYNTYNDELTPSEYNLIKKNIELILGNKERK